MQNFILISPNFPKTYYQFAKSLKKVGFRVLGIGDENIFAISNDLRENLDEYVYCPNMENIDNLIKSVQYLKDKYGDINYIESNNEYWLRNDAILREWFNVSTGVWPKELESWQRKSLMKQRYIDSGVKCARWILPKNKDEIQKFAAEVGYPLFIKPDIGVGAEGNFKIKNELDIDNFFNNKIDGIDYICEQYITGDIVSFDGIANSKSNVVFMTSHHFPPSVADVVKEGKDFFYYTEKEVPNDLKEAGRKIVKAFKIKKRFFHFEFFRLTQDIQGFGKVGDLFALESNMRTPGGYTPDMINFGNSINCYDLYAETMMKDETITKDIYPHYFCACVSRRDGKEYDYNDEEIINGYSKVLCMSGRYPDCLSNDLGNRYFIAKFEDFDDMKIFSRSVSRLKNMVSVKKRKNHFLTGEDIDMFNERKQEKSKSSSESICDTHIDGA